MNKLVLLATAASLATFALASTAGAASFTGWYGGVEAGANWVSDADGVNDTIDTTWSGGWVNTSQFDTGWALIGTAGYSFGKWRTELELGYRNNDMSSFQTTNGGYPDAGELSQLTVMANALYDVNVTPDYQVSLGGGIGIDSMHYENTADYHTIPIKDTDTVFAWQLMAGVSRFVPALNADVSLNYRFLQADSPSFRETETDGTIHNDDYDNIDNHAVTLGLRWH